MSDGSACERRVLAGGTGGHDSLAQTRHGEKSYVTPEIQSEGKISDSTERTCREKVLASELRLLIFAKYEELTKRLVCESCSCCSVETRSEA